MGALFIWWGVSVLPHVLPNNGIDAAGTGIILLSLNLARRLNRIPVNGFSMTCGILCVAWGGLDMMRSVFHLPFRPPVFAILLVLLGGILLFDALRKAYKRRADREKDVAST